MFLMRCKRNLSLILVSFGVIFFLWNLSKPLFFSKQGRFNKLLSNEKKANIYRSFTIIVYGTEDIEFLKKNLHSIFEQKYPCFHVIYINDGSSKEVIDKVQKWIASHGVKEKTTHVIHEHSLGKLQSLYHAIHQCRDEDLLIFVSGKDWLAHDHVLETLNRCYEDTNTWMTYGSFLEYPSYKDKRKNRRIDEKTHRNHDYRKKYKKQFHIPYLRSGYAGLFKKIQLKDLLEKEEFFSDDDDHILILPAVEMAKEHSHFVGDILYIQNLEKQKIDFRNVQKEKNAFSALSPYSPLSYWHIPTPEIDVVIQVKHEHPLFLISTLESMQFVSGYKKIWILVPKTEKWGEILTTLKLRFLQCHFIHEESALENSSANFFFVTNDHLFVSDRIDVVKYAKICHEIGGEYVNMEEGKNPFLEFSQEIDIEINKNDSKNAFIISKENFFLKKSMDSFPFISLNSKKKVISFYPQEFDSEKLLKQYENGLKIHLPFFLKNNDITLPNEEMFLIPGEEQGEK